LVNRLKETTKFSRFWIKVGKKLRNLAVFGQSSEINHEILIVLINFLTQNVELEPALIKFGSQLEICSILN
jgi:hypothetical protein